MMVGERLMGARSAGAVRRPTIADIATEIRRCLSHVPPDRHEALRWAAQFVADFERAPRNVRTKMVLEVPAATDDHRWDALLAAVVEHVCFHHGLPVPGWTFAPGRFLDRWWFVSPYRSLHASALVSTPAAFANRGVFLHSSSLTSV